MSRAAPVKTAAVKLVKLSALRPHPRNPRRHDRAELDDLKASFLAYGFTEPVVRQVSSGYIVAGNGRLTAALELAAAGKLDALEFTPGVRLNGRLPVVDKDMDDRAALAYLLIDNRLTERGTWDWPEVKAIMVEDLGLGPDATALDLPTGFEMPHLESLMAWEGKGDPLKQASRGKPGLTDDDAVLDAAPSRTKPGDVWLCGKHRVMCGDSTKPEDVARLMAGGKADAVVTDPPYMIMGSSTGAKSDPSISRPFFRLMWQTFRAVGAFDVYVCCDWRSYPTLVAEAVGYDMKAVIVWDKGSGGFGNPYRRRHEWIVFARPAASEVKMFDRSGAGGCSITDDDVWQSGRAKDKQHNAAKPVDIIGRAVNNSTKEGGIVADPFLGSGTTLIACEKLGRVCMGCDIEPKYVDVAVKRWQDFTGRRAVLESSGATF